MDANCPRCNQSYVSGADRFCVQCGYDLRSEDNPIPYNQQRRSYSTLRFLAVAIEYSGVVIILSAWIFALLWWTSVNALWQARDQDQIPIIFAWMNNVSWVLPIAWGMFGTITGMVIVAFGQVIQVFLDIRDDTHSTMRLTRQGNLMNLERDKAS